MTGARAINLCFHGIGTPARQLEPGEAAYWIGPDRFAAVLDRVRGRPEVWLSFDDGNASDVELALPMLRARHLRATFFPVAARLGAPGSVDADGLRELVSAGMGVGSHGLHHVPWRGLDDDRLHAELTLARDVIADAAGVPVTQAACPLGSYDRRVLRQLRRLGYTQVFTSDRAVPRATAWLQPRHSVQVDEPDAWPARTRRSRVLDAARVAVKRWR